MRYTNREKKPHGTLAAVRRHYRHKEPLCYACKQAEHREAVDRYAKTKRTGGRKKRTMEG